MSDFTEWESSEEVEPVSMVMSDYQSPAVVMGSLGLGLLLLMVGMAPGMFELGSDTVAAVSFVAGLVLAGAAIWAGLGEVISHRAVHLGQGSVLGITSLKHRPGFTGYSTLGDVEDVAGVYINPGPDLFSKTMEWTYPVALLMKDGRSITMANDGQAKDLEGYSLPLAYQYAQALGCELWIPDEKTYVKAVRRDGRYSIEPTKRDVGLFGRLVVIAAVAGLVWGLWALASSI